MTKGNNTTKQEKKQYHHLTKAQRVKIEVLIDVKDKNNKRLYNITKIAEYLGVDKSTISRELRKRIKSKINVKTGNRKNLPYSANLANDDYLFKRGLSKANYILDQYPKLKKYIEDKILIDKWAPDAIAGYINKKELYLEDEFTSISTTSIYRAIHYGILKVKKKDTRRMLKFEKKNSEKYDKPNSSSKRENSIELRPESINTREEFGHYEIDTVVGSSKGNKACLLTITERKTRFELIFRLNSKTSEEITKAFINLKNLLKNDFDKVFKSFTADNGTEFSNYKEIIKYVKSMIYFAHPYSSYERASNEKNNGMIRYFIKKGEDISKYSEIQINDIANWMNDYPRKLFDYSTSKEEFISNVIDIPKINKLFKFINCTL